ncbi:hypothetical protein FAI40_01555 [Acetobacteraceae bacterium]|nr:hypothetical protein FAI40_01555 [Acetobacteraceae bacterium]
MKIFSSILKMKRAISLFSIPVAALCLSLGACTTSSDVSGSGNTSTFSNRQGVDANGNQIPVGVLGGAPSANQPASVAQSGISKTNG